MQFSIPRILQLFHIQSCYGFCEGTIAKVWRLLNSLKSFFCFFVMSIFKWLIKTKDLEWFQRCSSFNYPFGLFIYIWKNVTKETFEIFEFVRTYLHLMRTCVSSIEDVSRECNLFKFLHLKTNPPPPFFSQLTFHCMSQPNVGQVHMSI